MATLEELLRSPEGTAVTIDRPDGTRLHAVDAGSGPPVLLVHGYAASLDEWSLVQPALLDRGYRVIVYDNRAHGKSTLGSEGATSRGLFDDLVAVADHFDLRDMILVGHSMGTYTSLGGLAHPGLRSRVHSAVLVSTETGHLYKGARTVQLLAPLARVGALQKIANHRNLGRRVAALPIGPNPSPDIVEATRLMLVSAAPGVRGFISVLAKDSIEHLLPSIDVPLLLLIGDADATTPMWHSDLVVERTPHASVRVLSGVGHMVNWEAPGAIIDTDGHETAGTEPPQHAALRSLQRAGTSVCLSPQATASSQSSTRQNRRFRLKPISSGRLSDDARSARS